MPQVTMTMEEYLQLINGLTSEMPGMEGPSAVEEKPKRRSRAARAADKKLSRAFKEANKRLRTKNGSLRKGKTMSDVAKLAHRLRKGMK